ncbi:hypothetical protein [Cryobacterium fucosi]|nr:hypothetical protein [Cryobacterium fucosi]
MAYIDRRTAEGLFDRDIVRWLKRHVANEMFVLLAHPATALPSGPRLRQHRHTVGVVLTEAAKQLDVPYQRLRRLEIGQRAGPNLPYQRKFIGLTPQPNPTQKNRSLLWEHPLRGTRPTVFT